MLESPYTRMPVWRGSTDNIVGVVHAKDLLRALAEPDVEPENLDIIKIAQKPWFVPDSTNLEDQLNAFLRRKAHFAVVVDEYGEVQGLVTLEDILEEIVGDISDEHDIDIQGVRQEADGSIVVDGTVPIRDLNRALDWQSAGRGGDDHRRPGHPRVEDHPGGAARPSPSTASASSCMKREKNRITKLRIRPAEATQSRPPELSAVTSGSASPGAAGSTASACSPASSPASAASVMARCRASRLMPAKAPETIADAHVGFALAGRNPG